MVNIYGRLGIQASSALYKRDIHDRERMPPCENWFPVVVYDYHGLPIAVRPSHAPRFPRFRWGLYLLAFRLAFAGFLCPFMTKNINSLLFVDQEYKLKTDGVLSVLSPERSSFPTRVT
jgi:hypothetical protein